MKIFQITLLLFLAAFSNVYTQDFWEKTAGPDTATILSLAINSNGEIFAGTNLDGVFRSTDKGNSWTNLGILNYDITSMVISSSGDILVNTDPWGGVFRSLDNGNNWLDTLDFKHFNRSIAINNSNGYIFDGTAALGTWRSTDNGAYWEQIVNGMTASQVNSLMINSSGDLFAGTYGHGIFRTSNQGTNWIQINEGLTGTQALFVSSLAINSNGHIFAGTSGSGVFRSTDNGANWVQINQGIAGQGLYVYSLAINSSGDIFAGTDDGVFLSTDNGGNWLQINQGLTNKYTRSLAVNSNGDVYAGTEGGIFRTVPSANIKIFLQGPYLSGSMSTMLNTGGYIPLSQPYNMTPWNYSGTESVDTVPVGIVDWVLLELRSDLTTQVSRRAAFMKNDGSIVDLDGVSSVRFPTVTPGTYYVVIRHRNHLAVMTANKVTLSGLPTLYDMRTDQSKTYGTSAMKDLGGGFFGMITADTDGSGTVNASDRSNTWNERNLSGYYGTDVDLSGTVNAADRSATWNNRNISTQVP